MTGYGRTLDQRDFAGFAMLFMPGAECGMTRGARVIPGRLEAFRRIPKG